MTENELMAILNYYVALSDQMRLLCKADDGSGAFHGVMSQLNFYYNMTVIDMKSAVRNFIKNEFELERIMRLTPREILAEMTLFLQQR